MITQQSQIKINLPLALKEFLESRANRFDMPMASYVRHLILKDVSEIDFPNFKISDSSEKKAKKALSEKSKSIKVKNVKDYFKKL